MKYTIRIIGAVFLCVLAAFAVRAPGEAPENGGIITIEPGASLKSVGTELLEQHYIRSRFLFATLVTSFGGEHRISPGDYYFRQGEDVFGIARQIASGEHNLDPIKVTIPEGETVAEIAATLSEKLPGFDANAFIAIASEVEGYLFPETYFLYPKTTPQAVKDQMIKMFDKQAGPVIYEAGASTRDTIIMASLIEREAHGAEDRTIIAGILAKRLAIGMLLQVDVAPETYKNKGIPELPVANPGLEAIKAALDPAPTEYLYYLHDKHGTIHYAKTYAEHQKNIARYLK
jgi:UPF0755 protein